MNKEQAPIAPSPTKLYGTTKLRQPTWMGGKTLLILLALFLIGFVVWRISQEPAPNLLTNANFAEGLKDWETINSPGAAIFQKPSQFDPSHLILSFELPEESSGSRLGLGQQVLINPNHNYEALVAYQQAADVQNQDQIILQISQFDQTGQEIKSEDIPRSVSAATSPAPSGQQPGWNVLAHTFATDPQAASLQIGFGLFGAQAIAIAVDRIELRESELTWSSVVGRILQTLRTDAMASTALLTLLLGIAAYNLRQPLWSLGRRVNRFLRLMSRAIIISGLWPVGRSIGRLLQALGQAIRSALNILKTVIVPGVKEWGLSSYQTLIAGTSPLGLKLKALNWPLFVLGVLTALAFYAHTISFLQIQTISNGEAISLSNIPIEFALHNKIHYPLHGQDHFYPGIKTLVTHPPLHYYLAGWLFRYIGIGRWQIQFPGFIVNLMLITVAIIAARKLYNFTTAIVVAFLSTILYGLYFSWQSGRPDLTLGLVYALFLLALYSAWWYPAFERFRLFLSFLVGILAVAMMASHWNGIFAFLYLPFHLLMMARRQESWLKHGLTTTAGVIIALIPWFLLYPSDFLTVIFSAYIGGAKRFQTLTPQEGYNVMNFFLPITEWPGGWILGCGLLLALVYYLVALATIVPQIKSRFASKRLSQVRFSVKAIPEFGSWTTKLDLLLLGGLLGYIIFYLILIRNRHPQYMANIYFPLLLLSARGYTLGWDFIKKYTSNRRLIYRLTVSVIVIAASYYLIANVEWGNPFSLKDPNRTYNATRQALSRFVHPDYQIFMGVYAYQYLYDYQYKTNRAVEIETLQRRVYKEDFASIAQRRDLAKKSGQIMIMPDIFYMYQIRFFDEQVWFPNFKKVAAVGGFTILYRSDIAEKLYQALDLKPNTAGCDDNIWWIVYNPNDEEPHKITNHDWSRFSLAEKKAAVQDYFERHNWFGRPNVESEAWLAGMASTIDTYFEIATDQEWNRDLNLTRTLAQAIDVSAVASLVQCPQ